MWRTDVTWAARTDPTDFDDFLLHSRRNRRRYQRYLKTPTLCRTLDGMWSNLLPWPCSDLCTLSHILSSGAWWFGDWFDSSKAGENPLTSVNRYPVMMLWTCRFIESCFQTSKDSWFLSATGFSMLRSRRWFKKSLQSSWQSRCCAFRSCCIGGLGFGVCDIWESENLRSLALNVHRHLVISGLAECIRCSGDLVMKTGRLTTTELREKCGCDRTKS